MGELAVRAPAVGDPDGPGPAGRGSLEPLRPWMRGAAHEPIPAHARRAWIRDRVAEAAAGGDRTYGLYLGARVVGVCGLHRRIGPGGMELGYWVHVHFTRRGLATAAGSVAVARGVAPPGRR